jgi:Amt family ammonium transporter
MIGSAIITLSTFGVAVAVMYAVKAMGVLRVSAEGELMGLDVYEHGVPAYPEFVLTPSATPHGAIPHATPEATAHAVLTPATDNGIP